jgi:hypothetical protein
MSYLDIVKLRQKKIPEFLGVVVGVQQKIWTESESESQSHNFPESESESKKVDSAGHYPEGGLWEFWVYDNFYSTHWDLSALWVS